MPPGVVICALPIQLITFNLTTICPGTIFPKCNMLNDVLTCLTLHTTNLLQTTAIMKIHYCHRALCGSIRREKVPDFLLTLNGTQQQHVSCPIWTTIKTCLRPALDHQKKYKKLCHCCKITSSAD